MDRQDAPFEVLMMMDALLGPVIGQATTWPVQPAEAVMLEKLDSGVRSTSLDPMSRAGPESGGSGQPMTQVSCFLCVLSYAIGILFASEVRVGRVPIPTALGAINLIRMEQHAMAKLLVKQSIVQHAPTPGAPHGAFAAELTHGSCICAVRQRCTE